MELYYIFVLASRRHQHLSVGVTTVLSAGIKAHRKRVNRRLGKPRVWQKLVHVEAILGVRAAVDRHRELRRMDRGALEAVISSVNPGWDGISLRTLEAAGFGSRREATGSHR